MVKEKERILNRLEGKAIEIETEDILRGLN